MGRVAPSVIRWTHEKKRLMQLVPLNTGLSVLKMAGKFTYVIEGEDSEIYIQKYTFLPGGERGEERGSGNSGFYSFEVLNDL